MFPFWLLSQQLELLCADQHVQLTTSVKKINKTSLKDISAAPPPFPSLDRLTLECQINQSYAYLIVHVFTVNLGLDDVHERIDQSCALPQLPPRLASL